MDKNYQLQVRIGLLQRPARCIGIIFASDDFKWLRLFDAKSNFVLIGE